MARFADQDIAHPREILILEDMPRSLLVIFLRGINQICHMYGIREILGTALNKRYGNLGNAEDLERAITSHCEAILFCPTTTDDRINSFNTFGVVLFSRFECRKERDIDEAIAY